MNEIYAHISLVVCVVGGLVYLICHEKRPAAAELGLFAFIVGLAAALIGK